MMEQARLQNFRSRLLEMRDRLFASLDRVQTALTDDAASKREISTVRTHLADADSEGEDAELAVAHNEQEILEAIDHALLRIEHGGFGTCEKCGKEIPEARLQALPYAAHCIVCAE
jgi:RNA polymerase-binding transcription factor